MSYSRWSYSNWYSFWNSNSLPNDKGGQILSLWHTDVEAKEFSYEDLQSMDKNKLNNIFASISDDDINEGMQIISEFIHDVDKKFQENDEISSNRDS